MDNPAQAKNAYAGALHALSQLAPERWSGALAKLYHADVAWHGPHPINHLSGATEVCSTFWTPFLAALPDLERRDDILVCGDFKAGCWVAATGYYTGTFARDWLGITATGGVLNVRYGEFSRFENGRIREVYVILDLLDVLRQSGRWPDGISRGAGSPDRVPGPATADGTTLVPASVDESRRSMQLVEAMIAGLMQYDQKSLESMGMQRFWHPSMMWYGPGGIGTSRTLKGFQDVHQRKFLNAFPDRKGGDHKSRIADGAYVASTGWPSVRATHLGPWLGVPATGRAISMRVMDFWRREGNLLRENWVFIDQLDLLRQMDVDVLSMTR
jgi:predicted ester cyclase